MAEFNHESRVIPAEGIMNLRDLGGLPTIDGRKVKKGLLFRSGKLTDATESDKTMLAGRLHIGTVIDFRMEDETQQSPDPEIPGVENVYIKVFQTESAYEQQKRQNPVELLKGLLEEHFLPEFYWQVLSRETGQQGYGQFLRILADAPEGQAVLWHCSEGKDRAGLATVLILHVLGVSRNLIFEDFAYSNSVFAERIADFRESLKKLGFAGEEIDELLTVASVSEEYLKSAISRLESTYGSLDGYIKNQLKIDEETRELLRNKFLS